MTTDLGKVKLSESYTIGDYRGFEKQTDRNRIAELVFERLRERYIHPLVRTPRKDKHGFATMAVTCLLIETLECFYEGLPDTVKRGEGERVFVAFFKRKRLARFGIGGAEFYRAIRNGVLHQGETKEGWRLLRGGPMVNTVARAINATAFHSQIAASLASYRRELEASSWQSQLWQNLRKKMDAICANCVSPR